MPARRVVDSEIHIMHENIVLQISRLPEGATGKVLLTTRVINQTKVESF